MHIYDVSAMVIDLEVDDRECVVGAIQVIHERIINQNRMHKAKVHRPIISLRYESRSN